MGEEIYRGRVINLRKDNVTLPNGAEVELELFEHPGAAAIVPFDGERFTLIRQFRYAADQYLWEIPAGTLDDGEAPEACAARELVEEAGLQAGRWTKLGHIFTVPSFCTEKIHIFLAEDLTHVEAQHEADEVIVESRAVAPDEIRAMIRAGEICDAKSLVGLYHALDHVERSR